MSNNNQTPTNENVEVKTDNKVVEVKAKDVAKDKKKKDKVKKPNKMVKAIKDTGNELKKVSWPSFKQVVKQTGIVLVVVLVFALVIFGFERLCSWLTGFLY
ncbi:MAG: preprotein translocase subunit SecE [Clostridiales bacterium]|nr:preprotein translocase subunit SecE [Clostridiales bacterium]